MAKHRGLDTCTCGAKWLPVFEERLGEDGITVHFTQLIGSAPASAGTHGGGLCFDLVVVKTGGRTKASAYAHIVKIARQMGADATWYRPYNWNGRKGIAHVHGLGNGCPHLKQAARNQQNAVKNNRNGLANNGRDTGHRPLSGRTWQQGIKWAEKDMAISDADMNKLIKKMKAELFKADVVPIEDPIGTPESRKKNPKWQVLSVLSVGLREVVKTRNMVAEILDLLKSQNSGGSGKV